MVALNARPIGRIAACIAMSSVGCFLRIGVAMCATSGVRLANEWWARRRCAFAHSADSDAQLCRQGRRALSVAGATRREKDEKALRRSHFMLLFRQLIC